MSGLRALESAATSDRQLWDRADSEAFAQFYDRHARVVYNILHRRTASWSDAEDLTSVVFLHAWRRRADLPSDHRLELAGSLKSYPRGNRASGSGVLVGMGTAEVEGLREFYSAQQPRLVGVIALLTGSRAEAEDIVQEAFVRLVPRWAKVSRYDAPEAWVRLVAVRLAANRHRDGNRLTQLFRRLPAAHVPDPAETYGGDLERALAALPMPARQVVVLHYVCDLSVAQVADTLGIAEGTVKSRLSRAREVLSTTLRSPDHA